MKKMLIVAYNIHAGGGKTLLLALLKNLPKSLDFILYADSRLENELKTKTIQGVTLYLIFYE